MYLGSELGRDSLGLHGNVCLDLSCAWWVFSSFPPSLKSLGHLRITVNRDASRAM
jgi:hypothetical protein